MVLEFLEPIAWIAGIVGVPVSVYFGIRQVRGIRENSNPRTPPPGGEPRPRGTSNSNTTPRSIGFIDRPKLLGQILPPPPQQAGVAGPRIAAICSLHGMGGIGKTELAREAARQLAPNGIAEVNLRGWDSGQPMGEEEALRELCPQIDPATDPTYTLPQLRAHWRTITAREDLAVILDNLREPPPPAESLIERLRPTAGITLITGRERINRAGIQLIDVDVMEPDEAAALAIATHPGLSDADAAALAAAYLARSREPVSDLQRRIGQAAGGDTRTGMQALFERVVGLSTSDLSEDQRARWLALSLPPGDFGLWTVEALWDDADPLPELGELVKRHLILPAGEGRWRLHDLLRQYGKVIIEASPHIHTKHWIRLAGAMRNRSKFIRNFWIGRGTQFEALKLIDQDFSLFGEILDWSCAHTFEIAECDEALFYSRNDFPIGMRFPLTQHLNWFRCSFYVALINGKLPELAIASGNLGLTYRENKNYRNDINGIKYFTVSIQLSRILWNVNLYASGLLNVGFVYERLGKMHIAIDNYKKAREVSKKYNFNSVLIARAVSFHSGS